MSIRKKLWSRLIALVLAVTLAVPSVYIPARAEEIAVYETTDDNVEEPTEVPPEEEGSGEATSEDTAADDAATDEAATEKADDVENKTEENETSQNSETDEAATESLEAEDTEGVEEESNDSVAEAADSSVETAEEDYTILSEVEEKRDEESKTFLLDDGSFMVAQYGIPVHYEDENGKWQDIDTSLAEEAADAEDADGTYATTEKSGKKEKISFSKKLKEGKTIKIKGSDYTLSWGLVGAEKQSAVVETKEGEEKLTGNNKFLAQTDLSQKVVYRDIFEGVDAEYILYSEGIKENIILKEKGAQGEFEILYNIDKLTAVQEDAQTISLMNGGEVVYQIQAPYMADGAGERSRDVSISITETKNKKMTVTLTADEAWLASEERVYPVTIDPIILTKTAKSAIDTTFVTSAKPSANYSGKLELLVGKESSEYGNCRTLVKFKLPSLNKGDMVVDADLRLVTYDRGFYASETPNLQINAHQINQSWEIDEVTWNNKPLADATVLDYAYIKRSDDITEKYFDITEAVKGWYEGTASNYGIMIKSYNESGSYADTGVKGYFWPERYNEVTDAYPLIQITYRNNRGLEDYWTYTSLSAGTAGTAHINDYTGNLVFVHDDVSTTGELLPVTLQHVYNGYLASTKYKDSYPTDGRAWKLNIQRTLKDSSAYGLTGESLKMFPYAYEDGDGTVHFFYKKTEGDTTKYLDEDGLGLELTISGSTKTIKDKDGNTMTFGAKGNLTKIGDAYGNVIKLTYTTASDETSQITKVTDGAGHVLTFEEYDSGYHYLSKVTDPSGRVTKYAYPERGDIGSGYLGKITYPDGTYSIYEYDADGALIRAVSSDGSGLQFTYTTKAKGKRVKKVVEFGNDSVRNSDGTIKTIGTVGQTITFDRSQYNTTVIRTSGLDDAFNNDDDILTTYQFDDYGRTVNTRSKTSDGTYYGGDVYTYTAGKVNDSGSNIQKLNRVADSAYSSKNQRNYLKNHSAESTGNWSAAYWNAITSKYAAAITTEQSYFGNQSFKITGTEVPDDGGGAYVQSFNTETLLPGTTYTFSGYVKTSEVEAANALGLDYGACLAVRFVFAEKDSERLYSEYVTGTTSFNNGWTRISLTFKVPSDATMTRVCLLLRNATGTAYFDGLQVEYGSSMNSYNMFENASFEEVTDGKPDGWGTNNFSSSDGSTTERYFVGGTSVKITGEAAKDKYVYQQVTVGGSEKDIYVVSAWARAEAVKDKSGASRPFDIYAKIYYSDDTTVVKSKKAEFNRDVAGWQRASMTFNLDDGDDDKKRTPTKISIRLRYDNQANTAYFDHAQLVKDVAGSYTYDSKGNIITAAENGEQNTALSYNDTSDLTSVTNAENQTYKYEYNDAHQVTKATSPTGLKLLFTYNSKGPLLSSTISNSSGTMQIRNGKVYNSAEDGIAAYTYVVKEGDQNGYLTYYDYDVQSGNMLSVTTPNGVQTDYTYHEKSNALTKVSAGGSSVSYGYDKTNTKLLSITHNGFAYTFGYDVFGNVTTTQVAGTTLSTNTYAANNGKLKSVTYGNGHTKSYTYNRAGSVTAEAINGTKSHSWGYDWSQTPLWYKDHVSGQLHTYEYDITGRIIGSTITSTADDSVILASRYSYNNLNQLKKEQLKAGGRMTTVSYTYNEESQPSKVTFATGRALTYSYDALGRLKVKELSTETPVPFNYVYWNSKRNAEDAETKTYKTTQIAKELIGDKGYFYTYDKMGNIVEIKEGTRVEGTTENLQGLEVKVSYQYDSKNQLIREDNRHLEKIILYSYDAGGNLLTRTEYPYTEDGSLSEEPAAVVSYEYANEWKDQLTSYDGKAITYDEIGNPLSYRDKTLTWQGRNLATLTEGETSISYNYNSDGLRTKKVNGSETSQYYYSGSKLVYETRGNKELYYMYDASGALARINYYKNDALVGTYYVATTSRGDVEAIYNYLGEVRARYTYDSWGNVISVVDGDGALIPEENADHIGHVNPFRYRGYYYDAETGFYYVSSRYYDPEIRRFINADTTDILGVQSDLYDKNLYAYCDNNPIVRIDTSGYVWETIFDVLSLGASIMEVAINPADPFAWLGLVGDTADLLPVVTGIGETIRALKTADKFADGVDTSIDSYRNLKKINKGTEIEVHHIVEKRFSKDLGYGKTGGRMPSVALSKSNHRDYTNAWRRALTYGAQYERKDILEAAINIYAKDPELLGAAIYTIVKYY